MRKNGQIRMSETIAVLFIFFVLILFGLIFYYRYQQNAFLEKQEELLAARAIDTTLKTIFLPELICSKGDAEPEDNCFDMLKLRSINQTFSRHLDDYYFELFSFATISVTQVYPGNETWVLYDRRPQEFSRQEPTFFVVTLRDEAQAGVVPHHGFGYVEVVVYS